MPGSEIEVRRSRRRRRTVSAYREGEKVVVLIPARLTKAEEASWVTTMVERLERSEKRRRPTDNALQKRALYLSTKYLNGIPQPESVRWVENQNSRWGSCTPDDSAIRVSSRLKGMPAWVIDYVLIHELAHLIEPGHTKQFWSLVEAYPKAAKAIGFLEGVSFASHLGLDYAEIEPELGAGAASDIVD